MNAFSIFFIYKLNNEDEITQESRKVDGYAISDETYLCLPDEGLSVMVNEYSVMNAELVLLPVPSANAEC